MAAVMSLLSRTSLLITRRRRPALATHPLFEGIDRADVIELIETTLELRTRHLGLDPAWFGASSRELGRIDVR